MTWSLLLIGMTASKLGWANNFTSQFNMPLSAYLKIHSFTDSEIKGTEFIGASQLIFLTKSFIG